MNENTAKLVDQLREKVIEASDELIVNIVKEARDEALIDAKAILKERMIQAILESATDEQGKAKKSSSSGGTWFQPQPSV